MTCRRYSAVHGFPDSLLSVTYRRHIAVQVVHFPVRRRETCFPLEGGPTSGITLRSSFATGVNAAVLAAQEPRSAVVRGSGLISPPVRYRASNEVSCLCTRRRAWVPFEYQRDS